MDTWTSDDTEKERLMASWSRRSLSSIDQITVCSKENDRDNKAERVQWTDSNVTKICAGNQDVLQACSDSALCVFCLCPS